MNKLLIILLLAFAALRANAQVVNIPDANFKAELLSYSPKIDLNNNGQIEVDEARAVRRLNVGVSNIVDLKGIEAFTSLVQLDCFSNQLKTLDLSKNVALTLLDCSSNSLTTLNVSKNLFLDSLYCEDNQLTSLDVSKNVALTLLNCTSCQLTSLEVSMNAALVYLFVGGNNLISLNLDYNTLLTDLWCYFNQLTSLDVSKNIALKDLQCFSNPQLPKICLNNTQLGKTRSNPSNWFKDDAAVWSSTCATGIEDDLLLSTSKKLIKISTPLGQEIQPDQAKDGLYIYQYSDGSTKKVMKQ